MTQNVTELNTDKLEDFVQSLIFAVQSGSIDYENAVPMFKHPTGDRASRAVLSRLKMPISISGITARGNERRAILSAYCAAYHSAERNK